jgi:hypothetical protein
MHNKHYLGMNEGMNQSSLRCFDDSLIKKQGRTYSTDRSSLARYGDISLIKVQPRYGDISWMLKGLFYPPNIFFIPQRSFLSQTQQHQLKQNYPIIKSHLVQATGTNTSQFLKKLFTQTIINKLLQASLTRPSNFEIKISHDNDNDDDNQY